MKWLVTFRRAEPLGDWQCLRSYDSKDAAREAARNMRNRSAVRLHVRVAEMRGAFK